MCSVALFVTILCSSLPVQATITYWRSRPGFSSLYHGNPYIQRALPSRYLQQVFIPTQMRIQYPFVVARRRIVSLSRRAVPSISVLFRHQPVYNIRGSNQLINNRMSRHMTSLEEIRRQRTASVIAVNTNRVSSTSHAPVRVHSSRNRAFSSPLLAESVEERTSRRYLNREISSSSAGELQVGAVSMNNKQNTNKGITSARTSLKVNPNILLKQLPNKNKASGSPIVAENVKQRTSLNRQIEFLGGRHVGGILPNKNQATNKDYAAAPIPLKETSTGQLKRLSYRNGALKSPMLAESVTELPNIPAFNLKGNDNYNRMQNTQNTGDISISETTSTNSIVAAIIAGLDILKNRNNNNNNNAVLYT